MSLITEQSLRAIPGILTGSLSSISSVVTSLAALQSTNPGLFANFSGQIDSLMRGFDASANILNTVGGLADSARQLTTTSISPSNILQFAQNAANAERLLGEIVGGYDSRFAAVSSFRTSVQQVSEDVKQSESFMFFPENLGKYWFSMAFVPFAYNYRESVTGGAGIVTGPVSGSIMLPVPASLVDTNQVAYTQFNVVSEGLAAAMGGLGSLAQVFASARAGSFGQRAALTAQSGDLEGALKLAGQGQTLGNFLSVGGATAGLASYGFKLAQLYSGTAVNPATTLLLQGPMLKEHSFSWRFSPDSPSGSMKLNQIINKIKRDMSPTLSGGLFGNVAGLTLGYPKMVKCAFYNRDQLYYFKPAMITGFSVNYAPTNSPAFYSSKYPAEIEMKITMKEVEAWLAEDYGGPGFMASLPTGGQGPGRFNGVV